MCNKPNIDPIGDLDDAIIDAKMCVSSCCDPIDFYPDEIAGRCPDCGFPVDEDGDAVTGCGYSPEDCPTCGVRYCDGSC